MRVLLGLLLAVVAGFVLAGCGGERESAPSETLLAGAVPFDRAFMDAMVSHHLAAIAMAKSAKRAGLTEPELLGSSAIDPDRAAALGLTEQEMGDAALGRFSAGEDVDQAFASMMIEHHEGAVTMAKLALDRARHAEIKELAAAIIDAQEREIDLLEPHAGGMHHAG
jgi:uncharacterized protein (DUF305 family)